MAYLDLLFKVMGFASDEYSVVDCLHPKPHEVEVNMTSIEPVRALLGCELRIGDRVKISINCEYYSEMREWSGYVCGIRSRKNGTNLDIEVSDVWPPKYITDGFYPHDLSVIDKSEG